MPPKKHNMSATTIEDKTRPDQKTRLETRIDYTRLDHTGYTTLD